MFNINYNYQVKLNTNDLDLFINTLSQDILNWFSNQANFIDNFLPTIFEGGKIIDNWGLDLYQKDNLQALMNDESSKYLLTYRRTNRNLYKKKCLIPEIEYDFSFLIKDCPDAKFKLNVLADTFIEAIINNNQFYELEISTRVDFTTNQEIKKVKYNSNLSLTEVIERVDAFNQSFEFKNNSINYLSNGFTLKFYINKLN